jgi:tRNA pseudouridine55 synthase
VLLLGKYTKKAPELTKLDKTYEVTMCLGQTSTTGDIEGEMTTVSDNRPDEDEVRDVLSTFVGDQMQTPPIYSAIKVNGQRAYKLARAGKAPELKPRPVHINSIAFDSYDYPTVKFTADVSSGTYIRSLVEDIGKLLGTGAYMSDLRRTRIGDFSITDSIGMENMSPEVIIAHAAQLPLEP